jgi:hypothetical protein
MQNGSSTEESTTVVQLDMAGHKEDVFVCMAIKK